MGGPYDAMAVGNQSANRVIFLWAACGEGPDPGASGAGPFARTCVRNRPPATRTYASSWDVQRRRRPQLLEPNVYS